MYWKRVSLTSLPSRELATVSVRHELRNRFTECQLIRHIHVKTLTEITLQPQYLAPFRKTRAKL